MARMSFRDAMELVDDDLPDGAFWAMAHEMAGLEYGAGFDELACEQDRESAREWRRENPAFKVNKKLRAKVEKFGELVNHDRFHWQVRGPRKVIADWWPHKGKFRLNGQKTVVGNETAFLKALAEAVS